MGSSESGHLAVQVETRNIQAGSQIVGVIHFQLRRHIRAESLGLRLSGKEYCCWEETTTKTDSDGSESTSITKHKGKSMIVKQSFPIFLFQDSHVRPGDYSFPFSVATLATLPGSFEYSQEATSAYIRYHVSAFLFNFHGNIKKAKTSIGVTKRMSEAIISMQETVGAHVCTWCCFSKGEVRLSVYVNKSAYVPGELSYITVEVDNSRARLDVYGLEATLFRTIRLKENNGSTHVIKEEISNGFVGQLVPAGQVAAGPTALHLSLSISNDSIQNTTSLQSNHIDCLYTLVVKATMDGICMCCGRAPAVTRAVTIYPVQLPEAALPQAPAGWNPLVMQLVQFWSAEEYTPSATFLENCRSY